MLWSAASTYGHGTLIDTLCVLSLAKPILCRTRDRVSYWQIKAQRHVSLSPAAPAPDAFVRCRAPAACGSPVAAATSRASFSLRIILRDELCHTRRRAMPDREHPQKQHPPSSADREITMSGSPSQPWHLDPVWLSLPSLGSRGTS